MVFCVREIEALRLLGWCQYIRPAQLLRVVSETELSNLLAMKLIKYHGKSEALILTAEGRRLLAENIWLPDTPRTYHADAVVRRLRLASLLLTAYQSGINVYATQPDELAEGNALFLTSAGRGRGRNPWGSTRTAALLRIGDLLCAAHYVCPDIGCPPFRTIPSDCPEHAVSFFAAKAIWIFSLNWTSPHRRKNASSWPTAPLPAGFSNRSIFCPAMIPA